MFQIYCSVDSNISMEKQGLQIFRKIFPLQLDYSACPVTNWNE
jgi:hypothetical protein